MKKIKITEEQARKLGLIKPNKNVLKITKEQYDRIFNNKILKENEDKEIDKDPLYVEYYKEMQGEEPFEMNGHRYQFVWAKYPDGKVDIGTYAFGQDLVYAYDKFKAMHKLREDSDIKGGESRIDTSFKKEMPVSNDVVDLKPVDEDSEGSPMNIKRKNANIPSSIQDFGNPISISEEGSNLQSEMKGLIGRLYGKSNQLSSFWEQNGLSYEKICLELLKKGLIKADGDNYIITKSIGDKDQTMKAIEDTLTPLMQKSEGIDASVDLQEVDTTHVGSPDFEPELRKSGTLSKQPMSYKVLYINREMALLSKDGKLFFFNYQDSNFEDIIKNQYVGSWESGIESGKSELTIEDMQNFINDYASDMTVGIGDEGFNQGVDLVELDDYFKEWVESTYSLDSEIKNILNQTNEADDFISGVKKAFNEPSHGSGNKSREELRAIELARREKEKEDLKAQYDSAEEVDELDEMTSAGSVGGGYTAPLFGTIKRKLEEMTQGSDSTGEYTAPAFKMKKNHTDFAETNPKAFQKTQWADGSFVEFDDCTKLNNNKKAQNSGCSTGAVDGVVKQRKSKGNINAPSLNEGLMREALKLQHNKEKGTLIVISDLEGRAAGQETFKNKALLKQNGFEWNGTNWVIPANQLETAKKTLSLANKVEYIIDSLEELEGAVNSSATDDKTAADSKTLLKAKLEEYINDLANATDEVALSAEIRRYLTFFAKFHNYSYHNRILIYIQRPNATKVASYKTWQSKFRQVNKGSKGIMVLAPIISKSKKPEGEEEEDINLSSDVKGFRAVSVFDIADTSPMDERGEIPDTPKWFDDNTPSETADMLFGAVTEVAKDMGIDVTRDTSMKGEKGYSAGDHINISSDVEGVGGLSTMIHELAHELMHRKTSSIYYIDNGGGQSATELKELQAESVSYVVLKHYGIPVSHHATYLALWKANKERIQNNLEIISKVSQFIITKIDEQVASGK
jgi:hypothetical protein